MDPLGLESFVWRHAKSADNMTSCGTVLCDPCLRLWLLTYKDPNHICVMWYAYRKLCTPIRSKTINDFRTIFDLLTSGLSQLQKSSLKLTLAYSGYIKYWHQLLLGFGLCPFKYTRGKTWKFYVLRNFVLLRLLYIITFFLCKK